MGARYDLSNLDRYTRYRYRLLLELTIMLFNVWDNSQAMKTTIIAFNDVAAKQIFATRYGWLSDMEGYREFIDQLNIEKVR